ncbi:hypothetical protein [Shewanella sp. SR44-3]|uniref:hypothetical protein n=1 Tax=unclassified Shewanella TaxID=196818 RepID=UPI0015FBFE8D|nr:hypothetical protein [Shewanella sp. SR44-3]MBB1268320.1 hypothetical protein [Shewanella sp. SR44-3]
MFNLTQLTSRLTTQSSSLVKTGLVAATLTLASFSSQAVEIDASELLVAVEQNITQASQDALINAKQELILSLQEQISQQLYSVTEIDEAAIAFEINEQNLVVTQRSEAK